MYAALVNYPVKRGYLDEAIRLWREEVEPAAEGQGVSKLDVPRRGELSRKILGKGSSKFIGLLYMRGMPAVGEYLLAVATAVRRVPAPPRPAD